MKINKIVIHCSDTPNGRPDTAEDIHRWHLERGWDGIGYHYVIGVDGKIENGRPDYWMGSHVVWHNYGSLGVCLIGKNDFTEDQYRSLEFLIVGLMGKYANAEVVGHYELDPKKTCPNFDVKAWWDGKKKNHTWG